jgi:hypothetical protein
MTSPIRVTAEIHQPKPKRASRRRRVRRFAFLWSLLSMVAGAAACAGIYLATGTLDTAGALQVEAAQGSPTATLATQSATTSAATPTPTTTSPTQVAQAQATATLAPAQPTAGPSPTPQPTVVPAEIQGRLSADFEIGAHVGYGWLDETGKLQLMSGSGMTWIKEQLRFEPGMNADDQGWKVQYLHERGFKILWGVVGDKNQVLNPDFVSQYVAYVSRLAAIGSDAIEVWNEPNLDREWPTGQVSGASYTAFLRQAYEGIKAANPNTMVISAATAPTGFFGGCQAGGCDDNVFYQQMADAGAAQYMDCIGAHYNEGIVSPTATSGDPRSEYPTRYLIPNTDRAWQPFGGAKPVCYTELGYLTPEGFSGPLPPGFEWAANVTVVQQASWLATAALILDQTDHVRLMIIWNLDYKDYNPDPHGGFAMIRPTGGCPACDSLWAIRAE